VSPSRREFLLSVGAAGAIYVVLPSGVATAAATAATSVPPPLLDRHGLPPCTRLEQLRCAECGQLIGEALIDFAYSSGASLVVCRDCYRSMEKDLEEAEADQHLANDDLEREDLQDELDELQEKHERLRAKHTSLQGAYDRLRWQLRDVELDLRNREPGLARAVERLREGLEDVALPLEA
jgi:peptidoglycan hydrolase CwlO-like protein